MGVAGVIGGTYLIFRALAPKRNAIVVSDEEREAYRGGDVNQTDVGNKTARAPEAGLKTP